MDIENKGLILSDIENKGLILSDIENKGLSGCRKAKGAAIGHAFYAQKFCSYSFSIASRQN